MGRTGKGQTIDLLSPSGQEGFRGFLQGGTRGKDIVHQKGGVSRGRTAGEKAAADIGGSLTGVGQIRLHLTLFPLQKQGNEGQMQKGGQLLGQQTTLVIAPSF